MLSLITAMAGFQGIGTWRKAPSWVKEGQGVARGETLATRLFNHPAGTHLHFEIRNHATSAWEDGTPGIAQDPLATPNIFPVPSKTRLPKLLQIGLTHNNPGKEV